jgi:hypothetical protein
MAVRGTAIKRIAADAACVAAGRMAAVAGTCCFVHSINQAQEKDNV